MTRIAIVGAGPAGFYAADKLLRSDAVTAVNLIDRVPTPWGLVRSGVAPDHPNIKSVSRVYEKTAALEGFAFHGGIDVGRDISHDELLAHHHAVVYSYGASRDRTLGIPGEDLPGSHAATDFVAWYNGHPDACDSQFSLSGERAVVIGNGNVALDVARMLALSAAELRATDMADHAIAALSASSISEIVTLGRRGPAQAAYTTPELRELGDLAEADVAVEPPDVPLEEAEGATGRNVEVVRDYLARAPSGRRRRVVLRFLSSPVEIVGDDCVRGVRVVRNELVDGRALATGDEDLIPCSLVLRAVGYRGAPIAGVPFDAERGVIPNDAGRVAPGVYTAGWIKRGPSGVIGTNKKCANDTVVSVLADLPSLPSPVGSGEAFVALLDERVPRRVDYSGWRRIDAHERDRGEAEGRPRVKLVRASELLERAAG